VARRSRLAELLKDLPDQPSPRIRAAKLNGRLGALVTNARADIEQKTAWGEIAGNATLSRYGHSYYSHIAKDSFKKGRERRLAARTPEF